MIFEEMNNKVALITGATFGIGREAAVLFAKLGAHVVFAGRSEKEGLQLQKEIEASGMIARFIKTDVSNSKSVHSLIDQTVKTFGPIDYAINNAGIEGNLGPLSAMEERDFDEVIGINLKGIFFCLKFQKEAMAKKGGAIVNTSSVLARIGAANTGLYSASKAGVESLTRVAAAEFAPHVRVNAVSPGAIDTPMLRRIYSEEEMTKKPAENPLNKLGHPQDIAKTILFLCSSFAGHINGETILVDGGDLITAGTANE